MTAADFRRIALSMPEAVEGSHFGSADFRVGNKIFATLALQKEGYGVLLLTPEQQAGMIEDEPNIFSPVPGRWGRDAHSWNFLLDADGQHLGAGDYVVERTGGGFIY
ncbi:MAG: MmcQ/YjbR family DNA-binding protein [Terriglobales bacterium]